MSRLKRKNRNDIILKTGPITNLLDNAIKMLWLINDEEFNFIVDETNDNDQQIRLLTYYGEITFSEKKKALKIVDDLLKKYYNQK